MNCKCQRGKLKDGLGKELWPVNPVNLTSFPRQAGDGFTTLAYLFGVSNVFGAKSGCGR